MGFEFPYSSQIRSYKLPTRDKGKGVGEEMAKKPESVDPSLVSIKSTKSRLENQALLFLEVKYGSQPAILDK